MTTDKPIPTELMNRLGRVVFAKQWLRESPNLMDVMSDELFVVEARQSAETDEVIVVACCDRFDPVENVHRPDRYSFDYDEWVKSGRVVFTKVAMAYKPKLPLSGRVNGG